MKANSIDSSSAKKDSAQGEQDNQKTKQKFTDSIQELQSENQSIDDEDTDYLQNEKEYNTASQEEFSEADIDMQALVDTYKSDKKLEEKKYFEEEIYDEDFKKIQQEQLQKNNLANKIQQDNLFVSEIQTEINQIEHNGDDAYFFHEKKYVNHKKPEPKNVKIRRTITQEEEEQNRLALKKALQENSDERSLGGSMDDEQNITDSMRELSYDEIEQKDNVIFNSEFKKDNSISQVDTRPRNKTDNTWIKYKSDFYSTLTENSNFDDINLMKKSESVNLAQKINNRDIDKEGKKLDELKKKQNQK